MRLNSLLPPHPCRQYLGSIELGHAAALVHVLQQGPALQAGPQGPAGILGGVAAEGQAWGLALRLLARWALQPQVAAAAAPNLQQQAAPTGAAQPPQSPQQLLEQAVSTVVARLHGPPLPPFAASGAMLFLGAACRGESTSFLPLGWMSVCCPAPVSTTTCPC